MNTNVTQHWYFEPPGKFPGASSHVCAQLKPTVTIILLREIGNKRGRLPVTNCL